MKLATAFDQTSIGSKLNYVIESTIPTIDFPIISKGILSTVIKAADLASLVVLLYFLKKASAIWLLNTFALHKNRIFM